jgi:transposase
MASRDEKIAQAQRLRSEGLTYRDIGEQLGVTHSAVIKWLDPERERKRQRRDNQRPERKQAKRAWERAVYSDPARRKPCPSCGRPTGSLLWDSRSPQECAACRHERRLARWVQIEAWWAQGLLRREICERLDWTQRRLSAELGRMRKAGRDVPPRPRGRFKHHREQVAA